MILENLTEAARIEEYHRHERLLNKWYKEDMKIAKIEGRLIGYGLGISVIVLEVIYALVKGV